MKIVRITYYAAALVTALWSLQASATSATCDAALILLSGNRISTSTTSMEKLHREIKNDYADVEYVDTSSYDEKTGVGNLKKRISKKFPHRSEFVVVGHSLGGDFAYALAQSLDVNLLVTLDPVSRRGILANKEKPEGAREWINIYIGGWKKFFRNCLPPLSMYIGTDCFALAGGDWGREPRAKNIKFKGGHSDVRGMYERIRSEVHSALRCE